MSRTDLDVTTLANSLRMMAGDGSIEWVYEPIQASVLLDIADILTENAKLRELVRELWEGYNDPRCEECQLKDTPTCADCPICAREALVIDRMRELGIEVEE